ncbi:SRPBCC family protein [Saccharothrix sp. Mg75]|uniref:SRPBCC family protein n=1 Tax=Saccharothrix sp. Mg75 TaxID=3445357 RepID=UPI003EE8C329
MRLEHRFTAPAPVPAVWAVLLDPEAVAPCMPGATLTGVDGPSFTGTVKVKLGPVSLLYRGTGEFTSVDEAARTAVLTAAGKDSRGNGTASATVSVALTAAGDGTDVSVVTEVRVTGRPAQFGRGLIGEVAGKVVAEFAERLAARLAPAEAEGVTAPEATARPRLHAVPDEPLDLLDTGGAPALRRVLPVAAGLAVLVLLVRAVRRRRS